MVNVGIFYDRSEYFMSIWYNLWPFGIVCGHLVNFFPNLVRLDQEKSGNPGLHSHFRDEDQERVNGSTLFSSTFFVDIFSSTLLRMWSKKVCTVVMVTILSELFSLGIFLKVTKVSQNRYATFWAEAVERITLTKHWLVNSFTKASGHPDR
jgi:hypothetical protein